jgi:hypothetical protein
MNNMTKDIKRFNILGQSDKKNKGHIAILKAHKDDNFELNPAISK